MLTISDYWLSALLGTILPAVTALVAARVAAPGVKATILAVLAAVTGWLTSLQATSGQFDVRSAAVGIAVTFVSAVVAHFGLLKPIGLTGRQGLIAGVFPAGVGGRDVPVRSGTPASDPGPAPY